MVAHQFVIRKPVQWISLFFFIKVASHVSKIRSLLARLFISLSLIFYHIVDGQPYYPKSFYRIATIHWWWTTLAQTLYLYIMHVGTVDALDWKCYICQCRWFFYTFTPINERIESTSTRIFISYIECIYSVYWICTKLLYDMHILYNI